MKLIAVPVLFLLMIACNPTPNVDNKEQPEKWIQLFNGKDLDGWIIKINKHPLGENFNNTFRVRDGKLVTCYEDYDGFDDEFGHIFYKKPYSHYKLRVEYRILGEQVEGGPDWAHKNSGVMYHSQAPETMLVNQDFPVCLEAQFLGGLGEGERPTGNLCTLGTHVVIGGKLETQHTIYSTSETYNGEEWIHFELVVHGDSIIHHIVDGDTVLTYSKPQIGGGLPEGFPLAEGTLLHSGYIALQAESHPFEFRKIELLDLDRNKETKLKPEETEDWSREPEVVIPGIGTRPPSDAIVLFGGPADTINWVHTNGEPMKWKGEDDLTVVPKSGDIQTKQHFGNVQLHIEWRIPETIDGQGQERGNSGIYLMGQYEVQVLDSYGNETYYNGQAGSIYKQHIPLVNACRPPGEWQIFDIFFEAPRFDENESLETPAYMTIVQNGVLIQNHVKLLGPTVYSGKPSYWIHGDRLPLLLQDHSSTVSYRNIWIRELS